MTTKMLFKSFPTQMKASLVTKYGTNFYETYKYVEDFELPIKSESDLKPVEVLVEIKAAGVNPIDYKISTGSYSIMMPIKHFPHIVGNDMAGTIVAVGSSVNRFKIGDEVFGMKYGGSYAQYGVYDESCLAHRPASVSVEEAAALPVALLAAYQALLKVQHVKPEEESILILGGSGGVGSFMIILAKHYFKFKHVYATSSGKNANYVKSLGADSVIDYTREQFETVLQGTQLIAVLDTVGETDTIEKAVSILKPSSQFGIYITITTPSYVSEGGLFNFLKFGLTIGWNKTKSLFNYPYYQMVMAEQNGEQLEKVTNWMADNNMLDKVPVTVMPLQDAAKAHEQSMSRRTVGKLVLKI